MEKYLLFIALFFVLTKSFCQTANSEMYNKPDYYYEQTDFCFIDTLSYWNYDLILSSKNIWNDSVAKPIARITFFRTKALYDTTSRRIYGGDWTPRIDFEIYNIVDSVKCFARSQFTRYLSSCVPPGVGGDIFVLGNFIFLNNDVCLHCDTFDNHVDYCRPTIKNIFTKVKLDKVSSLKEIVEQFHIKQSRPK